MLFGLTQTTTTLDHALWINPDNLNCTMLFGQLHWTMLFGLTRTTTTLDHALWINPVNNYTGPCSLD